MSQRGAIELGSPAYTKNHSRKYTWYKKTQTAFNLLKAELIWEWQLYRGEDKYPRKQVMTYDQAVRKNQEFSNSFVSKVNTDPERRLWEWRLIQKQDYFTTRRVIIDELFRQDLLEDEEAIKQRIEEENAN